jgi:ATP-dependent Clp protease ATP-binding subunit ClpB
MAFSGRVNTKVELDATISQCLQRLCRRLHTLVCFAHEVDAEQINVEGVTRPLLEKISVPVSDLRGRLTQEIEGRPRIQGGTYDQRIGNELRATIDAAEKEMAKLKDEFLSAEHYLLALAD